VNRRVGFLAATVGALAVFVAPAGAHSSALSIDPVISSDGSMGQVTGSLTCTAGDKFLFGAKISQGGTTVDTTGPSTAGNTCTGAPQAYHIKFTGSIAAGSADVTVTVFTATGSTLHGTPTSTSATVTVVI